MIDSDLDDLTHNGYCVLREQFASSLIDACRIAVWPTLLAHVERHEPNRGPNRHYFAMPFDPPRFSPQFFFNEALLQIVRGAMDDRIVADQWGCDVPVQGSTYQDAHVDFARPLFAESPAKFFLKVVDAQIEFFRDEKGSVTHLVLHQGGRDMKGLRK